MNSEDNSLGGTTRRQFIKKSGMAAAAVAATGSILRTPVYGQDKAPSANVIGANSKINVGYIGVGAQGMTHVNTQKAAAAANNIVQVAACDLSEYRRNDAKTTIGGDCKTYKDFNELLQQPDIDAVTIATVDHWHGRASIAALNAGKHVYCEKPMTRYLPEAFEVEAAVKKSGKIYQVGSQGCTAAGWHKAADLIKGGDIGELVWAQGFYCRNSKGGEWNYPIQPWANAQDINWDEWQKPVHDKKAFDADSYFRWRKYYSYCAGLLGDLVPHRLLPLMLATGSPEFPKRVTAIGTKAIHSDKGTPGTPERDSPEFIELLAEFPSGLTISIVTCTVAARSPGFVIYGHKGTLEIGTSGEIVKVLPETTFADELDPETFDGLTPTEDIPAHEKNWFDSIRANKQPNAGIDLAVRAQAVISLAEMSNRMNIMCCFDEASRKVTTAEGQELAMLNYGVLEPS
jgi:predicted dehydrogenase